MESVWQRSLSNRDALIVWQASPVKRPPKLSGVSFTAAMGELFGPFERNPWTGSWRQQSLSLGLTPTTSRGSDLVLYEELRLYPGSIGMVGWIDSPTISRYNGSARCDNPAATLYSACGTMEPYTLLIIARTQSIVKRLQSVLDMGQYIIRWAPSSNQALALDLHPSLLVLDVPPSGGDRCVSRLKRRFDVLLLALLREDQPAPDQVDAHLSRLASTKDLVQAIEATLISHSPHTLCVAGMSLDTETGRLQLNGNLRQLRPLACRILAVLMLRSGHVVPRDELFRRVWHTTASDNTRSLDVHIAYLRRELEQDPRRPTLILTERGVGYRLELPDSDHE